MDFKGFPRCTVDYPVDLTADELASLSGPVNTLLKSNYLLGTSPDIESGFHSLFDLAQELGNTDRCAYISWDSAADSYEIVLTRRLSSTDRSNPALSDAAAVARHFRKPVHLDARTDPRLLSLCQPWNATSLAAFPVRKGRDFVGAVVFANAGERTFSTTQIKLLWILAMQAEVLLHQSDAIESLSFYSFHDPLTRLHNRRFFDSQIENEIFRSRRTGNPFALLMIDIDGFKDYNDRFLHTNGDVALQELAEILRDSVREIDTVARFGADEFAIIVSECTPEDARNLSARIADAFHEHLLPGATDKRTERGSVSIGVASFLLDSFDKESLLGKADRALYAAKSMGGGKVCLFQNIAELPEAGRSSCDVPIQKVFDAARSVVDMDRFLEILLFTSMQGLSAERGSIVVTGPTGDFTLRATIGFNNGGKHLGRGSKVPPGAVTSWVVDHRLPLVVSGQNDPSLPTRSQRNEYQTGSFLSMPLIHEGKLLGALHLTNRSDNRPFSRQDLAAFEPIASGISSILYKGVEFSESVKLFSLSILRSLSTALEVRYPFLGGHSDRVRNISLRIGERLGLGTEEMSNLSTAAELHDIGIVGVPGNLLSTQKRLSEHELEIARKHPLLGSKILSDVPNLDETRRIILEHHELFNGSGYPNGLRGEEICLGARILGLAEYYDSITSERPHRGALRPDEALQLVRNGANVIFDPDVARCFAADPPPH